MNREIKSVAVTGSQGYIGSILCRLLLEKGYHVHACDWNANKHDPSLNDYNSFSFCSFDHPDFVNIVTTKNVQAIIHLAATSLVGPSFLEPLNYYHNNCSRTINFLQSLVTKEWKGHFIFASTAAVYGSTYSSNDEAFTENDKEDPSNYYGISKYLTEQILKSTHLYNIKSTSFRFFNVVGAYKHLGEEINDTHILSRLSTCALNNDVFEIYGNDYPTRDGTCIRDYVHVVDICEAMIHNLQTERRTYEVFNLGTKLGTSVKEIYDQFVKVTGISPRVRVVERRKGDPHSLVANPDNYCRISGFEYTKSNLKDMINSTWIHYKRINNGL